MKKFFLFAAAAVAALTINAQTYDFAEFAFAEADLTVSNGSKAFNDSKGYWEIKNAAGETVVMTIAGLPNVEFSYKNSSEKTAYTVKPNGYVCFNGDQRDLTFKGIAAGKYITLTVGSKGSTPNSFEDSESKGAGLTGLSWVSGNKTQPAKSSEVVYEDIVVRVTSSSAATLRCTAGGYNLTKIVISDNGPSQGIDNVEAVKVEKFYREGQLIIRKNGVEYNALGARL